MNIDIAIYIWNILWDYQVFFAFVVILIVWLVIRGTDLFRWMRRRARRSPAEEDQSNVQ